MAFLHRRTFLKTTAVVASSVLIPGKAEAQVPWSSGIERPTFELPERSIDTHMHIYDDRFPSAPGVKLKPQNASVQDYRLLQKRLGFSRNVVVTPSTYGTDNGAMLSALQQMGKDARGVAVVDTSVTSEMLKQMDAAGVRGIRFQLAYPGATTEDMLVPLALRIAPLGWHIQLVVPADRLAAMESKLTGLPCPLVIDHIAHVRQPDGLRSTGYQVAKRLLDSGNTWIKLSGPYVDSKVGAPDYADVAVVAKIFINAAPERMMWGSDWPHPSETTVKPDDAVVLDAIASWIPGEHRKQIFVENPHALYRFD